MDRLGVDQYEDFRRVVLKATGVSFCTRLHFGSMLPGERERYIRFSYSGIGVDTIVEGLERMKAFVESSGPRAQARSA